MENPAFDKNARKAGFIHFGGLEGDRTLDLCDANAALSQLSYEPILTDIIDFADWDDS